MTNFTPIDRSGKGNFTMFHTTETLDRALAIAEPVTRASLYLSLVVIYFWFGGMKFTEYEAQGLVPLVSNSPLVGWFYDLLSVRGFSAFLGVIELSIGLLVLVGLFNPAISVLGGLLSAGLFVTTLSFMATTPGTGLGQFRQRDPVPVAAGGPPRRVRLSARDRGQAVNAQKPFAEGATR
jgi:uncharacterized membrane protein YkgB